MLKTINGTPLRELHHSARSGVYFAKFAADHWQHVAAHDGERPAQVGPIYKSRGELLADSNRYCRESWGVE